MILVVNDQTSLWLMIQ